MINMISKPSFTLEGEKWCQLCPNIPQGAQRIAATLYPEIKILLHEDFEFAIYSVAEDDSFVIPDDDLNRISEANDWLREPCGENLLGQFQASFSFLSLCRKQDRWTEHSTTYGLKSHVEFLSDLYVSDGAFSRAALLAGFRLKPNRSDGSCRINLEFDAVHFYLLETLANVRRQIATESMAPVLGEQTSHSCLVLAAN